MPPLGQHVKNEGQGTWGHLKTWATGPHPRTELTGQAGSPDSVCPSGSHGAARG